MFDNQNGAGGIPEDGYFTVEFPLDTDASNVTDSDIVLNISDGLTLSNAFGHSNKVWIYTSTPQDWDGAGGTLIDDTLDDSGGFSIVHGPLDHFLVEAAGGGAIGEQQAGVQFGIDIIAQDPWDNTVFTFTDPDTVDLSDTTGTILDAATGTQTTQPFTDGELLNEQVEIRQSDKWVTITATDTGGVGTGTGTGSETGVSNQFDIYPGPADHFTLSQPDVVLTASDGTVAGTSTRFDVISNEVAVTRIADLAPGVALPGESIRMFDIRIDNSHPTDDLTMNGIDILVGKNTDAVFSAVEPDRVISSMTVEDLTNGGTYTNTSPPGTVSPVTITLGGGITVSAGGNTLDLRVLVQLQPDISGVPNIQLRVGSLDGQRSGTGVDGVNNYSDRTPITSPGGWSSPSHTPRPGAATRLPGTAGTAGGRLCETGCTWP